VHSLFQDSRGMRSLKIATVRRKKHQNRVLITTAKKPRIPFTISIE